MRMSDKMNSTTSRLVCAFFAAALVFLTADSAAADVPFAFVYYYGRGWPQLATIPIALAIEFLVLRLYFDMPWKRALLADLSMNAVSTIVGFLFFPLFAFVLALLGIFAVKGVAEVAGTVIVIAFIDAAIEFGVLRGAFSERLTWKRAIALFAGNLASAVIITGSFWLPNGMATLYSNATGENDGSNPVGGLIFDGGGALYGTTRTGGTFDNGVVFKLMPPAGGEAPWTPTTLHSFIGGADGSAPIDGLIFDSSGALYGTTRGEVRTSNRGTVFKLTPPSVEGKPWACTTLYSFTGANDGVDPVADLIFDTSGALYGTEERRGLNDGTVFKLTPPTGEGKPWTLTTLYSFTGIGYAFPRRAAGLIFDTSGALYGTTGSFVVKLTPPVGEGTPWTPTTLHSSKGRAALSAGLIFDSSGALYGSTESSVFKPTPPAGGETPWTLTTLYSFTDGYGPTGLISDSSGALYGTTPYQGIGYCGVPEAKQLEKCGTVFKLTPPSVEGKPWTRTTLYSFTGGNDGGDPGARLIFDTSGALYGTTERGATFDKGVVFKLTPPAGGEVPWSLTLLHSFAGRAAGLNLGIGLDLRDPRGGGK